TRRMASFGAASGGWVIGQAPDSACWRRSQDAPRAAAREITSGLFSSSRSRTERSRARAARVEARSGRGAGGSLEDAEVGPKIAWLGNLPLECWAAAIPLATLRAASLYLDSWSMSPAYRRSRPAAGVAAG